MNLLGISWGMGARDVGMKAAVTGAQSNLDKLNDTLAQQSKNFAKSKGPGFWAKMKEGVARFNIASIASDVRSLTGDTGNLSNSLESMAVANAKAAKPFVASLNLTGQEMKRMTSRISGMAIGMNVGAETVAKVFVTMQQAAGPAKHALDALGYSQKDWVKIVETTGVQMTDFTDVMGGMGLLWKAEAKDEVVFLNRLVEIGKKAGLGAQPIKSLKENIETLGKPFEKLPPELQRSGKEMIGLAESATRMGGVFRELGSSEEEATSLGMQTAAMFAEQAVALERSTKYGLQKIEDSPLASWLMKLGVDYQQAIDIVEVGSRDSVKGVQLIQEQFKRFGMGGAQQQAMLSELSGALGESASGLGYLAQNTDAGAKALARMNAMTITGKDSLRSYANQAFSSGRTLQESYDLAKEAFDTQIRSISRKDVVGLVSSKMGAFREVGKEMKALAEEGGPMSMLVRGMSTFKQMGIQGVFLQVGKAMGMDVKAAQKMSIKLGLGMETVQEFAKEMGPLVNMLGQFGPMGIAAGGIAGFFMLDDADRAKIVGALEPMWEKVKQGASDIWYGTEGKTGLSTWLAESWDSFKAYVQSKWPEWKETIKGAFGWIVRELGPAVMEGLSTVGSAIMENLSGSSIAIGGALTGAIMGAKVFGVGGLLAGGISGAILAGVGMAVAGASAEINKARGVEAARNKKIEDERRAALSKRREASLGMGVEEEQQKLGITGSRDLASNISGATKKAMLAAKAQAWIDKGGGIFAQKTLEYEQGMVDVAAGTRSMASLMMQSAEDMAFIDMDKAKKDLADMKGQLGAVSELQNLPAVQAAMSAAAARGGHGAAAEYAALIQDLTMTYGVYDKAGAAAAVEWELGFRNQREQDMKDERKVLSAAWEKWGITTDDFGNAISVEGTEYLDPTQEMSIPDDAYDVSLPPTEPLDAAAQGFAQSVADSNMTVVQAVTSAQEEMLKQSSAMQVGAYDAGVALTTKEAEGIVAGMTVMDDALMDAAMLASNRMTVHSPIKDGPLKDVGLGREKDPAYMAGRTLMASFAAGIDAGAATVTESMALMLQDSVLGTIDAYQVEMQKAAANKGLLSQVAGMLMKEFGASVESTVTVDGQAEDVRATMKAMLNVPGLAGVTMAIINESAKQRRILDKIRENTEAMAKTVSDKGGKPAFNVVLPS